MNAENNPAPSRIGRDAFVRRFGGVFEHSPWVAEHAWDAGLGPEHDGVEGLHAAMCRAMRAAPRERRLALIRAHPDLAGRLAVAGRLTATSTREQASAGLDQCTPEEYARFQALNESYTGKFGFPFVMAVRGRSRAEILTAFERRIGNKPERELEAALAQIERIARLRLEDLLA